MLDRSAGGRYAKALFELSREQRLDAEVEAALLELSKALKSSSDTARLLTHPQLSTAQKRAVFSKALLGLSAPASELLLNFLSVLFAKHRFGLLHEIASEFKVISDKAQGESVALVRTAQPLEAVDQARLLAVLEKRTGTKVAMKLEVDPQILGGVEVRIGNRTIEGTVRGNLSRLKEELLRRN